jgi:hypothetical protein
MRDVRLTQKTLSNGQKILDIQIENGRANWAYDGTEVAQHAGIRLQKFVGESVIDDPNEDYTKWYETIFRADKSVAEKELEQKRRILGTTGAVRILTFNWQQIEEVANVDSSIQTLWGEADISEEITPL